MRPPTAAAASRVYSNDLANNFTTSFSSAGITAHPANFAETNLSLGSALTISDGSHSRASTTSPKRAGRRQHLHHLGTTTTTAGTLLAAIANAASTIHATTTPSNSGGDLVLAAANNVGLTIGGAIGSALGL